MVGRGRAFGRRSVRELVLPRRGLVGPRDWLAGDGCRRGSYCSSDTAWAEYLVAAERVQGRGTARCLADKSGNDTNDYGGPSVGVRVCTYFMGARLPAGLDCQLNYRVAQDVEELVRRARLFRVREECCSGLAGARQSIQPPRQLR